MKFKSLFAIITVLSALLLCLPQELIAQDHHEEDEHASEAAAHGEEAEFDPGTFILDHIADSPE